MEIAKIRAALPPEAGRLLVCALHGAPFEIGKVKHAPKLIAIAIACAVDSMNREGFDLWIEGASPEEWAEASQAVSDFRTGERSIFWGAHPAGRGLYEQTREEYEIASQCAFLRVMNGIGGPLDAYWNAIRRVGKGLRPMSAQRELDALDRIFEGCDLEESGEVEA